MSLPYRLFCVVMLLLLVFHVGGCAPAYTSHPMDVQDTVDSDTTVCVPPLSQAMVCVPPLSQYPDFPTGCESVAAVMALHYAGISIRVEDFVDDHLLCDNTFYESDGLLYGPDPYTAFIGDPRSTSSYGCMAPVIEKALLSCMDPKDIVINTTGKDLPTLCREYINNDIPVILWATMEMRPVGRGKMWFLPDGRQFIWPAGEHCLLLVGYNEKEYIFNDPRHGATVAYDKSSVEVAYASLGNQSLVIQSQK